MRILGFTFVALATLLLDSAEGDGHERSTDRARRFVGVTLPSQSLEIGCAQTGVLASMSVKDGQRVKVGDELFRLTTRIEELEVARLKVESTSRAAIREAEARQVHAERELTRVRDLNERGIAGAADLQKSRRDAEIAKIQVDRAEVAHDVLVIRHREAEARLEQRIVRSPVDGYVAERLRNPGEFVDDRKPVLRMVRLDPMWVEFDCPIEDAELFPIGRTVTATVDSGTAAPGDSGSVAAKVIFASAVADAASQTFRVRLELSGAVSWKTGRKVFVVARSR